MVGKFPCGHISGTNGGRSKIRQRVKKVTNSQMVMDHLPSKVKEPNSTAASQVMLNFLKQQNFVIDCRESSKQ